MNYTLPFVKTIWTESLSFPILDIKEFCKILGRGLGGEAPEKILTILAVMSQLLRLREKKTPAFGAIAADQRVRKLFQAYQMKVQVMRRLHEKY